MPLRSRIIRSIDIFGVPVELLVRHFEKRFSELICAVASLGVGLLLLASPRSLEASDYQYLANFGVGSYLSIIVFMSIGIARIIALALNGHWMPGGGYTRAVLAGVGAAMWGQLAAALWWKGMEPGHYLSPSFPILVTLTQAEIISIYRALLGVRRWKDYGKTD